MTQGLRNLLDLPNMEALLRDAGVLPDSDAGAPSGATAGRAPEADANPPNRHAEATMRRQPPPTPPTPTPQRALADAAQARLDMIEGHDHAQAMDQLHKETLKHAQDLMDLGFNIDLPRARGIFEVAANMYGRSIEAKNAKRDAELKAMKLALEQRKLDLYEQRTQSTVVAPTTFQGEATVIKEDRNELIKRLREQQRSN